MCGHKKMKIYLVIRRPGYNTLFGTESLVMTSSLLKLHLLPLEKRDSTEFPSIDVLQTAMKQKVV